MDLIPGLNSTASALDAEKLRLNVIAQNIANAFTTRGPDGQPYQRKGVSFESVLEGEQTAGQARTASVRVSGIYADQTPGKTIYNPQHPDADENGMVSLPNVELSHEMVDLITSSRSYEANLQVASTARQMAKQALDLGKQS